MRRAAFALALFVAACDAHPYDPAQAPAVTVTAGDVPVASWTPDGARLVRVFAGASAGDGGYSAAFVWGVAAGAPNGLRAPVRYGETPAGATAERAAPPLERGRTYTVWVLRDDPKGSGDGFTNTRRRYTGTATFTY